MLREARRRKQQIAEKIGHEEYVYRLNGEPFTHQEIIRVHPQGNFDPRQVPAAGARVVKVVGARAAGGPSRPPFAVDNEADYKGGDGARRDHGAALAPVSHLPAADPSQGAVVMYSPPGGNNAGGAPVVNYASPYGGGMGGFSQPVVTHAQPVAPTFAPVLPSIAPVSDLPPPLPALYRPKPPLTFHNSPVSGPGAPPLSFSPPPGNLTPGPGYYPSGDAPAPRFTAAPAYVVLRDQSERRPMTSPIVLPPLNHNVGDNRGADPVPTYPSRPSTSGGGVGGLVFGSGGLSAAEERHREKMMARQRAIELQQENARQILEQQQRKKTEREREIQEERLNEERLRREREEVARREQAEVDREKREMELKKMGPLSAHAILEQKQRETQQRREEEAAARRNKGRTPAFAADLTPEMKPVPSPSSSPSSNKGDPTSSPSLPPVGGVLPLSVPPFLLPSSSAPASASASAPTYFPDPQLGGGLRHPVQVSLGSTYLPPVNTPSQAAPLWNLEAQSIRKELQRITALLEEQQLQQQRVKDSAHLGASMKPQPFHCGAPPPTTTAGAGTYLTTGARFPFERPGGGALPSSTAQGGGTAPYSSLLTGGTLPPLATSAPLTSSLPSAGAPSAGIRPWQELFAPQTGSSATAARGSPLSPQPRSVSHRPSYPVENDVELPTEPSQFIFPTKAPVAATPSPSLTLARRPNPESPHKVASSSAALSAGVAKSASSQPTVNSPPPAMVVSVPLSELASPLGRSPALSSMPDGNFSTSSSAGKVSLSVSHSSSSGSMGLVSEPAVRDGPERREGGPMMIDIDDSSEESQENDECDDVTDISDEDVHS